MSSAGRPYTQEATCAEHGPDVGHDEDGQAGPAAAARPPGSVRMATAPRADGLGGEIGAVGPVARQGDVKISLPDLAGVDRDPGDGACGDRDLPDRRRAWSPARSAGGPDWSLDA